MKGLVIIPSGDEVVRDHKIYIITLIVSSHIMSNMRRLTPIWDLACFLQAKWYRGIHPRRTKCFAVSKVSLRGGAMLSVKHLFWVGSIFSLDRFGGEKSKPKISSREYVLEVSLEIEARAIGLELGPDPLWWSYRLFGRRKKGIWGGALLNWLTCILNQIKNSINTLKWIEAMQK